MFIEVTKLDGRTVMLNINEIAGIGKAQSTRDGSEIVNIWWAADDSETQYQETYEEVKQAISALMGRPVYKVKIDPVEYKAGDMYS